MKKLLIFFLFFNLTLVQCSWATVDLDGVDDYISLGDVDITGEVSLSVWFNMDATSTNPQSPIGKDAASWIYYIIPNNHATANYRNRLDFVTGSGDNVITTELSPTTWYHIVCTHNNTGDITKVYLNGVLEVLQLDTGNNIADTVRFLLIGATDEGTPLHDFAGLVSEFAAWNSILTQNGVSNLYSRVKGIPLQTDRANLIWYLPLDDFTSGTGINAATFLDLSGNGNNGTGVDGDADSISVGEEVLSYPLNSISGL